MKKIRKNMALIVGGTDNKGVVQTVWFVSLVKYKG